MHRGPYAFPDKQPQGPPLSNLWEKRWNVSKFKICCNGFQAIQKHPLTSLPIVHLVVHFNEPRPVNPNDSLSFPSRQCLTTDSSVLGLSIRRGCDDTQRRRRLLGAAIAKLRSKMSSQGAFEHRIQPLKSHRAHRMDFYSASGTHN